MPQAATIAVRPQPTAPARRGACPTLRDPMPTGDGLIARFRPLDGTLGLSALSAVARAVEAHGNGFVEITRRGSLQVRGLASATAAPFARAVTATLDVETGVPVETPPLAGLDARPDPRPLAAALRRAIAEAGLAGRLPPKVVVIVDGGEDLAGLAADVRVDAAGRGWRVDAGEPLAEAPAIARVLARLEAIAGQAPLGRAAPPAPGIAPPTGTPLLEDGTHALGLALPFGIIEVRALTALAEAAVAAGAREIRLAPRHGLYIVGLLAEAVAPLRDRARSLGFVADPADPRLAIAACAGNAGCASGQIAARALAARLAEVAPALFDGSLTLHVSGCAKGCAHPRSAPVTLVGLPGGACGLVLAGPASSGPATILSPDGACAGLARLARLYRARARAQESAAEWLARLGPEGIVAALRK